MENSLYAVHRRPHRMDILHITNDHLDSAVFISYRLAPAKHPHNTAVLLKARNQAPADETGATCY